MKTWIIYKHTLLIGEHAGWSYIGQTCKETAELRWQCGTGYKKCQIFWRAIRKYGWSNFKHEIIETNIPSLEVANERERYWISYYHTYIYDPECAGYNMTEGGSGSYWVDKNLPKTVKTKISNAHKGKSLKPETVNKLKVIRKKYYADPLNRKKQYDASTTKKSVFCLDTNEVFDSISAAARKYNINASSQISSAIRNKCKAGGYYWAYNTEESIAELKKYLVTHKFGSRPPTSEQARKNHSLGCVSKRKVICLETGKVYNSIKEAKIDTGCGSSIFNSLKDKTKTSLGLHWRYYDEK